MRTKKTLSRLEQIYGPPKQNNLSLGDIGRYSLYDIDLSVKSVALKPLSLL